MNTTHPITDTEAETIKNLEAVTSINRMGQQAAYLTDLVPVSASTSTEPSNLKVNLLSFDDMDKDSPFADKSYHLTDGEWIKPETQGSAVINAQFAQANGLKIGDTFSLEIESGKKVAVTVIGEYLTGNESQQEKTTAAVYRMENQIYIDNTTYVNLFDNCGFYKVLAYTGQPELLDTLAGEHTGDFAGKSRYYHIGCSISADESSFNTNNKSCSADAPADLFTGTMIVSLLLCMWMRSRQKEMAVLISMGEQKHIIFLQALLEAAIVFLIALVFACGFGTLTASWLQNLLFSSVETGASLEVSLQLTDVALLLGIGSGVVVIAVLLSLLPVIRANPKDILSRMEG